MPYEPPSTDLKLHVRAQDLVGIVANGGDVTTQWENRVTSDASTVSGLAGTQNPTLAAALRKGHAAVAFDRGAGGSILEWPASLANNHTAAMIAVVRGTDNAGTNLVPLGSWTDSSDWQALYWRETTALNHGYFQTGQTVVLANSSTPDDGGFDVFAIKKSGGVIGHFYWDGSDYDRQEFDAHVKAGLEPADTFLVGSNGFSGALFDGWVFEALYYSPAPADATVTTILEGLDEHYNEEQADTVLDISVNAFIQSLGPPGQQAIGHEFNAFLRDAGQGDDVIKKFSGRHIGKRT